MAEPEERQGVEALSYAGLFAGEEEARARRGWIGALPGLDPRLLARALLPRSTPRRPLPFPLDLVARRRHGAHRGSARASAWYLARNAVHHGLRALGLGDGAAVLLPGYHHGVEVEAVRSAGARVVFYRVDRRLRADLDDVRRKAEASGARALYLTHFAGFAQDVGAARALCVELGLLLVEDCALALLSRDPQGVPLGASSALSIFCLYKTLPVPHGGLAVCSAPLPAGRAPPLLQTLRHCAGSIHGHALASRSRLALPLGAARSLAGALSGPLAPSAKTGTRHLDAALLDLGASRLVGALLGCLDLDAVVARRRRNFLRLAAELGRRGAPLVPLVDGTCPLFYPLAVSDKPRALATLARHGVEGIDFWRDGDPACAGPEHGDAAWLRRHLLEVPIHQDLDEGAIERVACAVKEVLRDG